MITRLISHLENTFIKNYPKNLLKNTQIPCNAWFFVLRYYGAVKKTACSFDARGCDTLGCIATQSPVGFLVELAYYLK